MSEDFTPQGNRGNRPGEPKVPNQNWLIWPALVLLGLGLVFWRSQSRSIGEKVLTPQEFFQLVATNQVRGGLIEINPPPQALQTIRGLYQANPNSTNLTAFRVEMLVTDQDLRDLYKVHGFRSVERTGSWTTFLMSAAPLILGGVLIWFIFLRQIKAAGKGALSFGKSKARLLTKDRNKTTFKDVAGVEEAKDEVSELVEFLRDPKKFQKLGGRIPKGILMVGPPGTGKTLLAKAIAGEADASFFSISGSDFVEMFVGVGASRVRDMFEQARKNTPCLIFIDEIDAVGRSRGHGLGGGNDEREQTLNALLVEMDGFDTQEGIIIIAATNRPDVLDPALLRPGRFDRQVTVNLPDVRGREAILKVHAKNVKLDGVVDLSVIARGTPGFSGAELANLLNEAALLAARTGKKAIGMAELEEARDKVRWGRERRSMAMSEEEKKGTAWHEAGHAIVNVVLKHTHPLHKVTIIPRGQALGATMYLPKEDIHNRKRKELNDLIAVMMAGRIAEQMITDDISTGASGDIQQATSMAKAMVMHWGMSDQLGMVLYGESQEYVFLGRDMMRSKDYSEDTAQRIDAEVKRIIDAGFKTASDILNEHRDKVELVAQALLEHETLEGAQVEEIVRTGTFTPHSSGPGKSDPPSGAQASTPLPEVIKPVPPKLPGFGSPAPAAA
ncbi:MAG: ATP-dependent zinc metalloprotease FtsH [Verrucomicrobium sp.]|jgi:cell division protease FtsH|nr:ATP-dependent zinc metalloprotease FtsH [Verrucomicrobium sp.]